MIFRNDYDDTVRFRIESRIGEPGIYLELRDNGHTSTAIFPTNDAPALALSILEAAGVDINAEFPQNALEDAAESLGTHIRVAAAKAKRDEEVAKEAERNAARNERRDELAQEVAGDAAYAYRFAGPDLQRAIDRIIELEAR